MTREDYIARVREWLGVRFRHQGRSRMGVDCAGLVVETLRECGCLPAEMPSNYGRFPSGVMIETIRAHCRPLPAPAGRLAAMALIRWPGHKEASHVAICTGPTLIHAYQSCGQVVENGYRGPWVRDTDSLWMLPGIRYE